MTPAKPPQPPRPTASAVAPSVGTAAPAVPSRGLPLGWAGGLLGLGAVLLAAAAAYGLAPWFGAGAGPWASALGAAIGVAVAGAPLGWLMFRLAREIGPVAGTGEASAPAAGMPRTLFMTLAEREFARARRYGTGAALVLVDVDRYARLCEARGPGAGDAVLAALLGQTAPTLRTADVLTQFAGAQMAVFLAHADATGALDVAERIRERTEQLEVPYSGSTAGQAQMLRITVSSGVAHLRPAHLSLQALIDDAQDAVAAARAAGGNCVRAAPVDGSQGGAPGMPGTWRERRARPKQGGSA